MNTTLATLSLDVRALVEAASLAPSAENLQPWCFKVQDGALFIHVDRTRSLPSEMHSMLTLTGVGAAIENAAIACREQGVEPEVRFLSCDVSSDDKTAVAVAELRAAGESGGDPLAPFLALRCTCRRMKPPYAVDRSSLDRLTASIREFAGVQLDWVTERPQIHELAKLVGLGNRLRFEHEPFHRELYGNLRFTSAEAQRTKDGLDVAALQLTPSARSALRLLRTWRRTMFANLFGFSRVVQREAVREVTESAALGVLTVDTSSPKSFLEGGRALQRLWLSATAKGFGLHPAASLAVFRGYTEEISHSTTPANPLRVSDIAMRFDACLPHLGHRVLQMVFRLGRPERPRTRSLRRPFAELLLQ